MQNSCGTVFPTTDNSCPDCDTPITYDDISVEADASISDGQLICETKEVDDALSGKELNAKKFPAVSKKLFTELMALSMAKNSPYLETIEYLRKQLDEYNITGEEKAQALSSHLSATTNKITEISMDNAFKMADRDGKFELELKQTCAETQLALQKITSEKENSRLTRAKVTQALASIKLSEEQIYSERIKTHLAKKELQLKVIESALTAEKICLVTAQTAVEQQKLINMQAEKNLIDQKILNAIQEVLKTQATVNLIEKQTLTEIEKAKNLTAEYSRILEDAFFIKAKRTTEKLRPAEIRAGIRLKDADTAYRKGQLVTLTNAPEVNKEIEDRSNKTSIIIANINNGNNA